MDRSVSTGPPADPPDVPDMQRRTRVYPHHAVGIPLLVLVPVLAVFGAFGPASGTTVLDRETIRVHVEYPTRLRLGQRAELRIEVRNRGSSTLQEIAAIVDGAYLEAFTEVRFGPAPSGVPHPVIDSVAVGEAGTVSVSLEADRPGRHEGQIHLVASARETFVVRFRTTILP